MRNDYEVRGDTTAIIIKRLNGEVHEALVDTSDLGKLLAFDVKWHVLFTGLRIMAKATLFTSTEGKKKTKTSILLNRFILDFPQGKEVSFLNGNSLDSRKANLRITTRSETQQNRIGADRDNPTGVRNVTYHKASGKYIAQIKGKFQKSYATLEEAEEVAIALRKIYYPFSTN